jgi:hypothetical protein
MLALLCWCLLAGSATAAPLEKYRFLRISPEDHKAVLKTPDGSLQLVGQGDVIAENARVVEIAAGRVVLEEEGEAGVETIIIRLDGGRQSIERLRRQGERPPATAVPGKQ